jgi:hypothetical protein
MALALMHSPLTHAQNAYKCLQLQSLVNTASAAMSWFYGEVKCSGKRVADTLGDPLQKKIRIQNSAVLLKYKRHRFRTFAT